MTTATLPQDLADTLDDVADALAAMGQARATRHPTPRCGPTPPT